MYFTWGVYRSALSEAGIAFSRKPITSEATGLQIGIEESWTINGFLQGSGPEALAEMQLALEAAFSVNYMPAALIANDGVTILRSLLGITPLGGTRVTAAPSYLDDGRGNAEGSTYRSYQVVIEGRYALPAILVAPNVTLFWHETIQLLGTGGPRFVYRQPLNGMPKRQMTAQFTTMQIIQNGNAIGMLGWPDPPLPIWPEDEHQERRRIDMGNPERLGSIFTNWPISWSYSMERRWNYPTFDLKFQGN